MPNGVDRSKLSLSNLINFFDRDKEQAGFQLAKGGLTNRISRAVDRDPTMAGTQIVRGGVQGGVNRVKNLFQGNEFQRQTNSFFEPVKRFAQTPVSPTNPVARTVNFLDRNITQPFNTYAPFASPTAIGTRMANQAQYTGKLGAERQDKINRGEQPSLGDELNFGLNTVASVLPGVDDIAFGGYEYAKSRMAGQNPQDALSQFVGTPEEGPGITGIGTAAFGGKENFGSDILNLAELPVILFAGGLRAKNADEAVDIVKNRIDDVDTSKLTRYKNAIEDIIFSKKTLEGAGSTKKEEAILKKVQELVDIKSGSKQVEKASKADASKLIKNIQTAIENDSKATGNLYRKENPFKELNSLVNKTRVQKLQQDLTPELFKSVKANVLEPLTKEWADGIDWKKNYAKQIQSLNIAPGSKASAAVQDLGEGRVTISQLKNRFKDSDVKKIVAAENKMRGMYDEMLTFINTRRAEKGLDLIPKREDYFRHMGDLSGSISQSLASTGRQLLGGARTTAEKSSSIFKQQDGGKIKSDAIGGMVEYLDFAKRAGFTDLVAPDIDQYIKQLDGTGMRPETIGYLNDLKNVVLGTKKIDQFASLVERGTAPLRMSKVVGSLSSLLAQTFNLPTGVWDAGPINFMKSVANSDATQASKNSPYLRALRDDLPLALEKGPISKATSVAGKLMSGINNIIADILWKGYYQQGLQRGVPDAAKYAEDMIPKVMGDRRLGMLSSYLESPMGRVFSPFVIEQQAGINRLVELVGEKRAGTLLGIFITNHLLNNANEKYGTGNRSLVDPIDSVMSSYEYYTGSDDVKKDNTKAVGAILAGMLEFFPTAQSPFATGYSAASSLSGGAIPGSEEIFGSNDPAWMGQQKMLDLSSKRLTGNPTIDFVGTNILRRAPFGGQAIKTITGAKAIQEGAVTSKSGNPLFPVPDSGFEQARMLAFGPYSTEASRDFFDNDYTKSLTESQQKIYEKLPDKQSKQSYLENTLARNEAKARLKDQGATEEPGFIKNIINTITGGGEAEKVDTKTSDGQYDTELIKMMYNDDPSLLTTDELVHYYTNGIKEGEGSFGERMAEQDLFSKANSIYGSEKLTEEQKNAVLGEVMKKAGYEPTDYDYYLVARENNDEKMLYVQDQIAEIASRTKDRKELLSFLANGRKVVNQKMIVSNGVVDDLVDMGIISKAEGKILKSKKIGPGGEVTTSTSGRGGGSSLKNIKINYPKIKTQVAVQEAPKIQAIQTPSVDMGSINQQIEQLGKGVALNPEDYVSAPSRAVKNIRSSQFTRSLGG